MFLSCPTLIILTTVYAVKSYDVFSAFLAPNLLPRVEATSSCSGDRLVRFAPMPGDARSCRTPSPPQRHHTKTVHPFMTEAVIVLTSNDLVNAPHRHNSHSALQAKPARVESPASSLCCSVKRLSILPPSRPCSPPWCTAQKIT